MLPLVLVIIGASFVYAGYLIAIKKRFDLMTDFYKHRRMYVNHYSFARRHGFIELISGLTMFILGIFLSYYKLARQALLVAFFGTALTLFLLKLNKIFSPKKF